MNAIDPVTTVHDALGDAANSDEIYSLIYEHYQDACMNNPCSHGFNVCARLIGSIVIDAIRKYERDHDDCDTAENAAANAADNRVTDMREAS